MEISRIIEEDLRLTESPGVTRETGDLLRLIFPIFKEVVTEILPNPSDWKRIEDGTFTRKYEVPRYWKIPTIAGKSLTIHLTFYPSLNREIRITGSYTLAPALNINAVLSLEKGKRPEVVLDRLQARLKEFLIHELTHFKDERPRGEYPSFEKVQKGDFSYFAHPSEVRANVSHMVAMARKSRMGFLDVLYTYAEDLWALSCTPEEVEQLKSLYAKEYASRYPRWVGGKSSRLLPAKRRRAK